MTYEDHYNYMQSVIPRLTEAERIVDEIKSSPQWKRSSNYFKVLYKRGMLKENPAKKNGYKIKKNDDAISKQNILNAKYQIKEINGVEYVMLSEVQMKIRNAPSIER